MLSIKNELKSTSNRLGWTLAIMVGVMTVVMSLDAFILSFLEYLVNSQIMSRSAYVAWGAVIDTVCYLSYFLIPTMLFYVMSRKKKTQPIKFQVKFSKYLPLMILAGLAITQVAAILNAWFCDLVGYVIPSEDYVQYLTNPEMVALYMTVSLAPAFAEELLFRGVVYSHLRPYGKTFAILASAICFSLMHQNVGQSFYTMVAGVVMALIYEATGSIWGSIFLHMFNNLYAVLQTAVMYRYSEGTATVLIYLSEAVIIFAGVISTVCLLLVQKKNAQAQTNQRMGGVFEINSSTTEPASEALPASQALKIMSKTPGMITFVALSLGFTVLAYFGILLINWLGGLPI